ncbi:response regulator [Ramlibacter tataouinensis]|uniref:response regulator n=1 Tax=Ramlibacter tataouinensis TaxID=94132 RepID=UPI0022F3ECAA|nr:response regulator [Ramlibacter tataouinensis]WBY02463.1 response regulator [Ramlibacter tataouinensis]
MNPNDHYLVDVIGFNDVERAMLASIFALAARRDPGFAQFEPGTPGRTPDVYLVDADKPEAMKEFRSLHKRAGLPSVLIGTSAQGTDFPVLPRPLQWARLLQALDDVVSGGDDGAPFVAPPVDAHAHLRRSLPGASRSSSPQAAAQAGAAQRMMGDTVLVVDDNATVRAFMQAKLAPFGFEVDFAETGEEAIGLSGTHEYTCVFLDVVLPGIDGYQVCKLIKSNKQAIRKTAVVMLTSRSSPFDKLRGSLAGCDEYLTKPLDEDRLLEVIAKFLPSGRKQAERAARK